MDVGENHQVLVYGYEISGDIVTLHTYDPNHPNEDVWFSFNKLFTDRPLQRNRSHDTDKPVHAIFRTNYNFINPPAGGVQRIHSLRHYLPCWIDFSKGIRQVKTTISNISLRSITGL